MYNTRINCLFPDKIKSLLYSSTVEDLLLLFRGFESKSFDLVSVNAPTIRSFAGRRFATVSR